MCTTEKRSDLKSLCRGPCKVGFGKCTVFTLSAVDMISSFPRIFLSVQILWVIRTLLVHSQTDF